MKKEKSTLDKIKSAGTIAEGTEHALRFTLIPLFLLGFGFWFAIPVLGFVFMALAIFNTVSMKILSMGIKDEFKDGADIYKNAEGGSEINKQYEKSFDKIQDLQSEIKKTYLERKQLEDKQAKEKQTEIGHAENSQVEVEQFDNKDFNNPESNDLDYREFENAQFANVQSETKQFEAFKAPSKKSPTKFKEIEQDM